MKEKLLLIIMFISVLMLSGCKADTEPLKFVTGSVGGVYYPMGSAISEIVSDDLKEIEINSYTGNASVANSDLIINGDVDLALIQGNVAYWATNGEGMFEGLGTDRIKGIAALYSEVVQIIVRKDLGIHSFEELKGKRLNIGLEDSGHSLDAQTIIKAHGMELGDFEIVRFTLVEAAEAMAAGELDAMIVTSGVPSTSIQLLSKELQLDFISISPKVVTDLMGQQSYYASEIIEIGSYPDVNQNIQTVATKALWVCRSDLDEEIVYNITKAFMRTFENANKASIRGVEIDVSKALQGMSVELHPGALKYYKEMETLNE